MYFKRENNLIEAAAAAGFLCFNSPALIFFKYLITGMGKVKKSVCFSFFLDWCLLKLQKDQHVHLGFFTLLDESSTETLQQSHQEDFHCVPGRLNPGLLSGSSQLICGPTGPHQIYKLCRCTNAAKKKLFKSLNVLLIKGKYLKEFEYKKLILSWFPEFWCLS